MVLRRSVHEGRAEAGEEEEGRDSEDMVSEGSRVEESCVLKV
jgi:hypothetical protein